MSTNSYWAITLGLGLVVALVAVFFLQTFLRQLHRIEHDAAQLWQVGKEVARNTATTWQLGTTSNRLDGLIEEVGRHDELLRGSPSNGGT